MSLKRLVVSIFCLGLLMASTAYAQDEPAKATDTKEEQVYNVWAVVGDENITDSYINMIISELPEGAREDASSSTGKRRLLEDLVDMKLLAMEAENLGLLDDEDVQRRLTYARQRILAAQLISGFYNEYEPSGTEIREYYDTHLDEFRDPEKIRLRHILLDSEEEAREVLKELQNGADFEKLAVQRSLCVSRARGGDLGWVGRGKLLPKIESAAFALNKGEIGGIVESELGFHILKVDDRTSQEPKPFEAVKDDIVEILKRHYVSDKHMEIVNRLKETVHVEIK